MLGLLLRPDRSRIEEVGPQRACAEWLLRCGAHVRWEGLDQFQTDYNKLPSGNFQKFKIAEINADDAAVMELGFPHFGKFDNNCQGKWVYFRGNLHLTCISVE